MRLSYSRWLIERILLKISMYSSTASIVCEHLDGLTIADVD